MGKIYHMNVLGIDNITKTKQTQQNRSSELTDYICIIWSYPFATE